MALHRCGMEVERLRRVAGLLFLMAPLTLPRPCFWLDADGWEGIEVVVKKGRGGNGPRLLGEAKGAPPAGQVSASFLLGSTRGGGGRDLVVLVLLVPQNGKTEVLG